MEQEESRPLKKHIVTAFDVEDAIRKLLWSNSLLLRHSRDRVRLIIPEHIIYLFERQLCEKYRFSDYKRRWQYEGINIQCGYENKIILAHLDYPLHKEPWMYAEIIIP
jgi:hypothetical protein